MGRLKRHLPAAGLGILMSVVVVLAVLHPGMTTARVSLHDGGIWVTNKNKRLVGHLNYPSRTLDAGLRAASSDFGLSQHDSDVFVHDVASSTLAGLDVANVVLEQGTSMAGAIAYSHGGNRIGVLDTAQGRLFSLPVDSVEQFQPEAEKPDAQDLKKGVVATGVDGRVHAVSGVSHKLVSLIPQGVSTSVEENQIDVASDSQLAISSVGPLPVVLDTQSSLLYLPSGHKVQLQGENLRLQQPGPIADSVLVTSATHLFRIDLQSGAITKYAAQIKDSKDIQSGNPAAPVFFRGCAYSAWARTGIFLRLCGDSTAPMVIEAQQLASAQEPLFRTNRDIIVLNDVANGNVWLPDQKMVLVDSWDSVVANLEKDEKDNDDPDESREENEPERKEENQSPTAVDDSFGVRPGRATILPVLFNDLDPDGDVLVAKPVSEPEFGRIKEVRGGAMLQIEVPDEASGTTSFHYEANDGRGGTAQAKTTVTVHPWEHNAAPSQIRVPTVVLGAESKVVYNILPDWIDPDGDSIYVKSVSTDAQLGVNFREDGVVSIAHNGEKPGTVTVNVEVSDGKLSATGTMSVDIRAQGNIGPHANGDLVQAKAGEETTIHPLDNDTDANGDKLMLVSVGAPQGDASIVHDIHAGTVRFQAKDPGSYYMTYVVSDGPATASGVIRVDVVKSHKTAPPVAEDDTGMLPRGGQVIVDLTQNDSDPLGGVLVVQSVNLPQDSVLSVALVDQHLVRISALDDFDTAQEFTYTVSNGEATATAHVTVIPVDSVSFDDPPVAEPDSAKVRVNDIVGVNVLANDRSPSGSKLHVDSLLDGDVTTDLGTAFVSDNRVRFLAKNKTGTAKVTYTVYDTQGNKASAEVVFRITPMEVDTNSAPQPLDVEGRCLSGQKVVIPIPLDSIDHDGDSVYLLGLNSAATLGVAEVVGNSIHYSAGNGAVGTDSFTYLVEDRLGKRASGHVRVGIAPVPPTNQPPLAINDRVHVRPERSVAVSVVDNDVDPDGDELILKKGSVGSTDDALNLRQRDSRIVFKAPKQQGIYTASYQVSDGRGGTDNGLLTIQVSNDAPLAPPIARDDIVTADDVPHGATEFTVPVLANDDDPDGDVSKLKVTTSSSSASVDERNRINVKLSERRQIIVYTITDEDNLTSSAVIFVPALVGDGVAPRLDPTMIPAKVKAGTTLTIPLEDYVVVRKGRHPTLTQADKVSVQIGGSEKELVISDTQLVYAPPKTFSGNTAITFEVTDAASADDKDALTSTLTLPIKVKAAVNNPPLFRPTPIKVAADNTPVTVDLAAMVSDPEGEDPHSFSYKLVTGLKEVSTSLSGSQLTVTAPTKSKKGRLGNLKVEVSDAANSTRAEVPIEIVTSSQPPLQIADIEAEGFGGKSLEVDMADFVTNPFPGKELYFAARPQVFQGKAQTRTQGTKLFITPEPDFYGSVVVSVRMGDVTHDPLRERRGSVRISVVSQPQPPTNVVATATSDTSMTVQWVSGSAHGAPITSFTVRETTTGATQQCGGTQCVFHQLSQGHKYSFVVQATNRAGDSPWSQPSQPVLLDTAPDQPSEPVIQAGDSTLSATWPQTLSQGSPVTSYTVSLTSSTGVSKTKTVTKENVVFEGLSNGSVYQMRVQAHNASGKDSAWSPVSTAMPFGPPFSPRNVEATIETSTSTSSTARIVVMWDPPTTDNGKAVESYTVVSSRGERVTTQDRSASFNVPYSSSPVSFSVKATNEAGSSASVSSGQVRPLGKPGTPSVPTVRATGRSGEIRVSGIRGGQGQGWTRVSYQIATSSDPTWQTITGTSTTVYGVDGQAISVRVRAIGIIDGQIVPGKSSAASASVSPFGPPSIDQLEAVPTSSGEVQFTWSANGHGRPISVTASGDGPSGSLDAMSRHTVTGQPGQTKQMCLHVRQSESGKTADKCVSAQIPTPQQAAKIVKIDSKVVTIWTQGIKDSQVSNVSCWLIPASSSKDPAKNKVSGSLTDMLVYGGGEVTIHCDKQIPQDGSIEFDNGLRFDKYGIQ
ncbi:MAG: Ig-like domain-containing protein [Actinomycetaceae bacterium]|nr:Ig-like domain-containing protein [Actinomycetaceae bacterium]MDO5747009.1 Ig-like domain-containing protein [Actinomycetaceae bacterium]